jgi:hypothetical protein
MRRWLWIAAVLIVIVAGDAVLWMVAIRRLEAGLGEWVTAQRAAGWQVTVPDQQRGGWPFAAALRLSHVAIEGGEPFVRGGVAWRADRVVLRIAALHPMTLQIDASGAGRLRIAAGPDVPYTAGRLVVGVPLWTAITPNAVGISAEGLTTGQPRQTVTIHHLLARISLTPEAVAGEPAVSTSLSASGIVLPPGRDWALGQRIAALAADAALNGPLPAKGGLSERAITWRDDGGVLDIRALQAVWGPLRLHARARLQLDSDLQPVGAGSATLAGYTATADELAAHGVMTQGAAIAAKALLSLMAQAPPDGGASEVTVPLSLQRRTLSMRHVPLVRVPALDWPTQ